jgi:hypothetical protein
LKLIGQNSWNTPNSSFSLSFRSKPELLHT